MNFLDDFRFPTAPVPVPDPELCCLKCGAGDNCHEVKPEGLGVMSRQCKVCGQIGYRFAELDKKAPGSGVWERERVEKPCKNCGDLFLAWKSKFCKDCKTVNARRRKRRAMAGMRDRARETAPGAELEPCTV